MLTDLSCEERTSQIKLTQREKKIVEFIKQNGDSFLNDTITEFSERAGVSDATIVRFCKHLGYKGYQDFKVNCARQMISRDKQFNANLEREDDVSQVCSKVFNSEMSVLSRTLLEIDIKVLEEIARRLKNAGRVVFFGTGGSLNVAKDALHKFMKIGLMVYVYEDVDLQHMAASLLREGDVAVLISHSGSNMNTLRSLELARGNGAFTVALTGLGKNPISKVADITVHIASEKTIYRSESVSTRIAQLAVLDSLVGITANMDYENSYEAAMSTRRATSPAKF